MLDSWSLGRFVHVTCNQLVFVLTSCTSWRLRIVWLKKSLVDKSLPFGVDLAIPQLGGNARKTNHDYTHGHLNGSVNWLWLWEGWFDTDIETWVGQNICTTPVLWISSLQSTCWSISESVCKYPRKTIPQVVLQVHAILVVATLSPEADEFTAKEERHLTFKMDRKNQTKHPMFMIHAICSLYDDREITVW